MGRLNLCGEVQVEAGAIHLVLLLLVLFVPFFCFHDLAARQIKLVADSSAFKLVVFRGGPRVVEARMLAWAK